MKKFIFTSCVILLLLNAIYFFSCSQSTSSSDYPPGGFKGRIFDSSDHKPLSRVQLTTSPASEGAFTDTNGYFLISGIQMGSSAVNLHVVASKQGYVVDTFMVIVYSNDTANITFSMVPTNGIFVIDGLILNQYTSATSLSGVNMYDMVVEEDIAYDVDIKFRNNTNLVYLKTAYESATNSGLQTKFSPFLGSYTKHEFDTLASYYGASNPISPTADFPNDNTQILLTDSVKNNVYAFFLKGRYSPGYTRVYGLVHIDSAWFDGASNLYKIMVDAKINKNEQNYFIPGTLKK